MERTDFENSSRQKRGFHVQIYIIIIPRLRDRVVCLVGHVGIIALGNFLAHAGVGWNDAGGSNGCVWDDRGNPTMGES